ncbi:MAG: sulfatase [Haloferacaceae archaeon]
MPTPRNAVLVTVDSLRADVLDGAAPTPTMDALADRGTVFETAFAGGNWTPFSFPGLLGSRPVFVDHGGLGPGAAPTLAEALADAGYATAGFNAANGFLTRLWDYDRGFDRFDAFIDDPTSRYGAYLAAHPTLQAWRDLAAAPVRRLAAGLAGEGDAQPFMDASHTLDVERHAVDFVETAAAIDSPFFLWVHYMDAHTPYAPAPRYLRRVADGGRRSLLRMLWAHVRTGLGHQVGDRTLRTLRTLYRAAVLQADDSLSRVLDALSAAGIRDETVVVLAGDHGEEFMEHGHLAHYPKLYDELVHVPLVIDAPGAAGGRAAAPVALADVPPTVCDLLDAPVPDGWAGESRAPRLRAGTAGGGRGSGAGAPVGGAADAAGGAAADPVVSVAVRGDSVTTQPIPRHPNEGNLLVSARTDRWVYIETVATGEAELYDRRADPTQQEELLAAGRRPAALDDLRRAVAARAAAVERAVADDADDGDRGDGRRAVDDAGGVATRLDALGYR